MRHGLWIAPFLGMLGLATAAWPQEPVDPIHVVPMPMVGGYVVPAGTLLRVRVNEDLSTDRNESGDRFTGVLVDPVMVNGNVVIPMGTPFSGHVQVNHQAGIYEGRASLVLALDSFQVAGHHFPLELTSAMCAAYHPHKAIEEPDPNKGVATGNREVANIRAETIVNWSLGSPVRI